jgi:protein arginine N-methyltransferase 2
VLDLALLRPKIRTVAELHLREIGLDVAWSEVVVEDGGKDIWEGAVRRYWNVPSAYRLGVARLRLM